MATKKVTINLDENDVIKTVDNILIGGTTFTSEQLLEHIRNQLYISDADKPEYHWVGQGVECKVLQCQTNFKGWQSGRVRIVLEFIPEDFIPASNNSNNSSDDLDSPLDEIRKMT